ncbi:MAG: VOC family protein [Pseudohongiellaceae bacterium]
MWDFEANFKQLFPKVEADLKRRTVFSRRVRPDSKAYNSDRRSLLLAAPFALMSPMLGAQSESASIQLQKLHSFGIRVRDVAASVRFYQRVFGAPIQARQGNTVFMRIGSGPRFFSISPVAGGEAPSISHIGLSVNGFSIDAVSQQLQQFGVARGSKPVAGSAPLDHAMKYWEDVRLPDRGGHRLGTRELYFKDIEGITYQLGPTDHCGGSGLGGNVCEQLEESPVTGLFELTDLSHFTTFVANKDRANDFYTRTFDKQFQAYQGASFPLIGVGDGLQFLMYVGGKDQSPPTQAGRIDHACFNMNNFSVSHILDALTQLGLTARPENGETQPLMHWVSMRMPARGGVEGGTPEVYFSDPDGIRIQLQDQAYCGGGGYLGDSCPAL